MTFKTTRIIGNATNQGLNSEEKVKWPTLLGVVENIPSKCWEKSTEITALIWEIYLRDLCILRKVKEIRNPGRERELAALQKSVKTKKDRKSLRPRAKMTQVRSISVVAKFEEKIFNIKISNLLSIYNSMRLFSMRALVMVAILDKAAILVKLIFVKVVSVGQAENLATVFISLVIMMGDEETINKVQVICLQGLRTLVTLEVVVELSTRFKFQMMQKCQRLEQAQHIFI